MNNKLEKTTAVTGLSALLVAGAVGYRVSSQSPVPGMSPLLPPTGRLTTPLIHTNAPVKYPITNTVALQWDLPLSNQQVSGWIIHRTNSYIGQDFNVSNDPARIMFVRSNASVEQFSVSAYIAGCCTSPPSQIFLWPWTKQYVMVSWNGEYASLSNSTNVRGPWKLLTNVSSRSYSVPITTNIPSQMFYRSGTNLWINVY
jgi:hypothetical protein